MTLKKSGLEISGYDHMLYNLLPQLENYKHASGGEGNAYFIDDKFVVKELLYSDDHELFDDVFDLYVREMQGFASQGMNIPKIYSWCKIPNNRERKDRTQMPFKYYILEERVPGRWIYHSDCMDELYECCRDLCSIQELEEVLDTKFLHIELRREILKAYIKDFIEVNSKLEAMSDTELEKVVLNLCEMTEKGKYSVPDLFRKNILVSDKKITVIDNMLNKTDNQQDDVPAVDFLTCKLVELFHFNTKAKYNEVVKNRRHDLAESDISKLLEENQKICKAVIIKVLKTLNRALENNKIKSRAAYEMIKDGLQGVLGHKDAAEALKYVDVSFNRWP